MSDTSIKQLLDVQPLNVYVSAASWYKYSPSPTNDIFRCSSVESTKYQKLDHAVLLVGYGPGYWKIKNSWGEKYGLDGYIKVSSDPKANCGIGFFVGYL